MKGAAPNEKQMAAILRNHKVRRLRGIAATAREIEMPQTARNRILFAVDQALEFHGADSESVHRQKERNKLIEEQEIADVKELRERAGLLKDY